MTSTQSGIDNELDQAELEMKATQNNISRTRDAIAIVQAVLWAEEVKFGKIMRCNEDLTHQQAQIQ